MMPNGNGDGGRTTAEKEEKGKNGVKILSIMRLSFSDYFDLSYTTFYQPEITEYPSYENTLVNLPH